MEGFRENVVLTTDHMHALATHGRTTDARVERLARALLQLADRSSDRFDEIESRILALESKR